MNKNFLYKLELYMYFTRAIFHMLSDKKYTPWFPYIKNMILSTPFVFLQGIKKGLLKHPFLVQIYFSTTLIILFIRLPFYHLDSQLDYNSRTVRYCLVYFYRVCHIEMNHLRIRINDFVYLRLDWNCIVQISWEGNKRLPIFHL